MSSKKFTFFNFFHRFFNLNSGQLAAKGVHFMQKPNRTLLTIIKPLGAKNKKSFCLDWTKGFC
tara:strand:- start:314 stop:502 length:189 start_codon:yes stop_codon:yes gene_type:complete